MNEKLKRTFLCFPVPLEVKSKKNMLYSTLEGSPAQINWVKNDNLHLTLKFIGYTTESQIPKIISILSKITIKYKPFELVINSTGCFPKKERPRTLFLGVEGRLNVLSDLFQNIENEFEKIDIEKDRNVFFPHITLARIKYPQIHTPDIDLFLKSSYDPIDLSLDRVQFFSSELLPSGAIYTLLKTFPLGEQV
ncbi:MAG: RNA 2',3'-cyclic phosphodiesterase [Candidatus Neomarinimicrobiota bacterium]